MAGIRKLNLKALGHPTRADDQTGLSSLQAAACGSVNVSPPVPPLRLQALLNLAARRHESDDPEN